MQLSAYRHYYSIILIILVANVFGQYVGLAYLPLLPAIHVSFTISQNIAQLIVPCYLGGFAVAQIIAGFISDTIGRRKTFCIGIAMTFVGAIICIQSSQFSLLLLSFFLQAAGVGFIIPTTDAIVRDTFTDNKATTLFSFINLAVAVGAIVAPITDGLIELFFGWRWLFVLLVLLSIILFVFSMLFLRETCHPVNKKFYFLYFYRTLKKLFSEPSYLGFTLISSLLMSMIAAFNTAAPFLFQNIFHFGYRKIAFLLTIPNITMIIGLITTSILIKFVSRRRIINLGIALVCISAIVMLILAVNHHITVMAIMLPIAGLGFCIGLITPNYWTEALLSFSEIAASAAAFIIFFQNIFGVITSLIISKLHEYSQLPLAILIIVLAILSLSLHAMERRS